MDGTTSGSGGVHSTQPSEMKSLASWVAPTSPESAAAFTVGMATALLAGGHSSEGAEDSGALAEAEADWECFAGEVVTEVAGDIVSPVGIPKTLNLKSFRYTALSGNAAAPVPTTKSTEITRANPDARRVSLSPNRLSASLKSTQVAAHPTAPPAMRPLPHPSRYFFSSAGHHARWQSVLHGPGRARAKRRDARPGAAPAGPPLQRGVRAHAGGRRRPLHAPERARGGRVPRRVRAGIPLGLVSPAPQGASEPVLLPLRSPRAYFSFPRWQNSVAFSYAFDGDEDDDEADASDQRYRYRPGNTQPSPRETHMWPHTTHTHAPLALPWLLQSSCGCRAYRSACASAAWCCWARSTPRRTGCVTSPHVPYRPLPLAALTLSRPGLCSCLSIHVTSYHTVGGAAGSARGLPGQVSAPLDTRPPARAHLMTRLTAPVWCASGAR